MTKKITVFAVQLSPSLREIAQQAVTRAFSAAKLISTNSVVEALAKPSNGQQLILLGEVDEAGINTAAQAIDGDNLPRWAMVILGDSPFDLAESVPAEECQPALLARVFRAAVLQHELLRENLALRGDLKTIGRRFSHDLRSPLNCMHLTCELLQELPANRETIKPQIEVLRSSLSETFNIIERVSYMLRASTDPLPSLPISMDQVVNSVLKQLQEEQLFASAIVRRPLKWPEVKGVAQWLEVIWKNLIINAVKHAPPATPVQLGWSQEPTAIRFWVANQGNVLPAELQTQLFQRFDQMHTQPAPGLGLPIVQRLVALQGGHCSYERRKDDHSVFSFTLPQ